MQRLNVSLSQDQYNLSPGESDINFNYERVNMFSKTLFVAERVISKLTHLITIGYPKGNISNRCSEIIRTYEKFNEKLKIHTNNDLIHQLAFSIRVQLLTLLPEISKQQGQKAIRLAQTTLESFSYTDADKLYSALLSEFVKLKAEDIQDIIRMLKQHFETMWNTSESAKGAYNSFITKLEDKYPLKQLQNLINLTRTSDISPKTPASTQSIMLFAKRQKSEFVEDPLGVSKLKKSSSTPR